MPDGEQLTGIRDCVYDLSSVLYHGAQGGTVYAKYIGAVRAKGGTLACPVCGREGFTLVEMTVLGAGMAEQYGTRRQQRAQLVCENCGHVMNFDLAKVRATGGQS